MPHRPPTKTSTPTTSERKLSEVAKHLVLPSGIVSTGYPSVAAQCAKMGVEHDGWQRGLGRAILAKRANGKYAAGIGGIIISICRQVGKTFTIGTIIFALCIIFPRMKVIWTAHHSATSDETFDTLAALARRRRIAPYIKQVRGGNGKQRIVFTNGSRIMFGAREHGFGRGIPGVTIVVLDEAQILKSKALNDMVPAANTVKNPLVIYMGTPPTPTDPAEVFKSRRRKALKVEEQRKAGEDVKSNVLYLEVGAEEGDDPDSHETWAKANPSFPHRTDADAIQRLREQLDDEASFLREGLGIWDDDRDTVRAIPQARWTDTATDTAPDTAPVYGISFSADGMRMALAAAKIDGAEAFFEQLDADEGALDDGMAALAAWFAEKDENGHARWRRSRGIFISGSAHAPTFKQLLRQKKVPEKWITVLNTPMVMAACQTLDNELKAGTARHPADGQERLDASVESVKKEPRGKDGGWTWAAFTPDGDETPTEAVSFALYGARTSKLTGRLPSTGNGGKIL